MLLLMDDDQIHPILGAVNCSLGVILTEMSQFQEARLCLREAAKQFRRIHNRFISIGKTSQELIREWLTSY